MPNSEQDLLAIQVHFHEVIRQRASDLIEEHAVVMPELSYGYSVNEPGWFPIPGMFGGFSFWFDREGKTVKLITESWSRAVDGSGQRHEITPEGSRLVSEGFV